MKNLSHVFWTRIENRHGGGIPDLYGIKSWKKSAWLELKCIKQNSINLSPLQISWNYKHFRQGFNNYYIVRDTRSKVTKIYHGDKGREFADRLVAVRLRNLLTVKVSRFQSYGHGFAIR